MNTYKAIRFIKGIFGFCSCRGCHKRYSVKATFTAHLKNGKDKKYTRKFCMECAMNNLFINN